MSKQTRHSLGLAGLTGAALALTLSACGGSDSADPPTVRISGTAYKFNKPFTRIANATIRVAEN
ncbi:MAG: hypothetical protein C0423_12265, partial [Methylibium sp.]|nr:hypothetical protein [Methylibium sp.]